MSWLMSGHTSGERIGKRVVGDEWASMLVNMYINPYNVKYKHHNKYGLKNSQILVNIRKYVARAGLDTPLICVR